MLKKIFIQLLGLCVFLYLSSCSSKTEELLTLGLQSGYPPFEYVDETGAIVGFDVDLAHLIANKLGKKLHIKEMGFDALILSLKSGKIDILISGMSITPNRLNEIDMIPYHGEKVTSLNLLFWQKIPSEVSSLHDLKERTVSVQSGTYQENILQRYSFIESKTLENTMELILDIKYGKSTAALVEPHIGLELQRRFPNLMLLDVPLSIDEQVFGEGIGIDKKNKSLHAQVEKVLEELKISGALDDLHTKWFKGGS